jgi:hypothetical protein
MEDNEILGMLAGTEFKTAESVEQEEISNQQQENIQQENIQQEIKQVIDEPIVQADVANQNTFDEAKYLEEITGGKFKSKEELKQLLSEYEEYQQVKPKLTEYEQKLQESEGRIKPANEFIKALNDFEEKGGDRNLFLKVNSVDFDKLTAKETVMLKYKWQHPELTDKEIERKMERQYRISEHDGDADEEIQDLMTDLKLDSKEAKEFLNKYKVNVSIPDAEKKRIASEQENSQRIEKWQPEVQKIVDDFKEHTVDLDEKGTHKFTYNVSAEEKKALSQELANIVNHPSFAYTPEYVAAAKRIVQDRFIATKHNDIVRMAAEKARSITDLEWRKQVHNPSILKDEVPASAPSNKSIDQQNEEAMRRAEGY